MIWPFRRRPQAAGALTAGSTDIATDARYVSRPHVERALADAWAQGENLVIYGPSHQGKTTLLAQYLRGTDAIYVECRPDFKRTQIYRVALSGLGYAVVTEKKKRGKTSATITFGVKALGAEASAEGELEQTLRAVTVDLKNPSEVAHLIARIKTPPRLILNNFQMLDGGTRSNLLFDLTFFAERPGIRTVIVGSWTNEDYLEEIEPAVAGKFRYVLVPTWSDAELRGAAEQWLAGSTTLNVFRPRLDEYLSLAAGDISLFRALVEGSRDTNASEPPTGELPVQAMVLGRFRRGLSTKLKAIFAERGTYVTYVALQATSRFVNNPAFHPTPNAGESDYLRTRIDPETNRAYSDGRNVLLDRDGHPQYLEETTGEVVTMQTDIARFLLRQFHAAVQQGHKKFDLASLARAFVDQLSPTPIAVDDSRLKGVFAGFDEVQRQALIVPPMLAVDSTRDAMEIVDRRLFLFLKSGRLDDLEELIDEVLPRETPKARRRGHVSPDMTDDEKAAYVAKAMPGPQVALGDQPVNGERDESGEHDTQRHAKYKERPNVRARGATRPRGAIHES